MSLPTLEPGWAIRLLPMYFCPLDEDECATAREREVAGKSDTIPECHGHGDPEIIVDPEAKPFPWRFYASDLVNVAGGELEVMAEWTPDTPYTGTLPPGGSVVRASAPIGGGWDDAFFLVQESAIEGYLRRIEGGQGRLAIRLQLDDGGTR